MEETKSKPPLGDRLEQAKIAAVRGRHEARLLRYPNVVGVADGIQMKQGKLTGESCIVVLVQRKIAPSELDRNDILPKEVEGITVDVVEVGEMKPQPL